MLRVHQRVILVGKGGATGTCSPALGTHRLLGSGTEGSQHPGETPVLGLCVSCEQWTSSSAAASRAVGGRSHGFQLLHRSRWNWAFSSTLLSHSLSYLDLWVEVILWFVLCKWSRREPVN